MKDENLNVFFAPMQGYTDALYRRIHHDIVGGVDEYFTPFVRFDKGTIRSRDRRDIDVVANEGVPTATQLIANGREELVPLLDMIEENGLERVDLNLGCPFPMQTGRGRGAALLLSTERVREMMEEAEKRGGLRLSVKMRIGMNTKSEGLAVAQVLNDFDLKMVTVHARLGVQQYGGSVDEDAFDEVMNVLRHKVVYNGDIKRREDIDRVRGRWPGLHGVMIGRGLLARPVLAVEWKKDMTLKESEILGVVLRMHERLYVTACQQLQGDQQVLGRLRAFWEYQKPLIDKKVYKRLMKTTSLRNYDEAVRSLS